jgi:hypothetical protein
MSAPLTTAAPLESEPAAAQRSLPAWLREPLLHFTLLGALLFGVDHVLVGRADDPLAIVIGPEVDKEARELFKAERGQDPTPQQLEALRQRWLANEVLYREGLALQVDKGDTTIRERVIFKALNIVESNLKLPPSDERTLRAWFESNRAKYDEPARFDFQEATLAGQNTEAAVRAFVADLNSGAMGETKADLSVFKGRPHSNIVLSYSEAFAKALESAPPGEWRAYATRNGWRAMRLEAITPGKTAGFEVLANVVKQDWIDATMAEQRTAAVGALTRKYTVRVESGKP